MVSAALEGGRAGGPTQVLQLCHHGDGSRPSLSPHFPLPRRVNSATRRCALLTLWTRYPSPSLALAPRLPFRAALPSPAGGLGRFCERSCLMQIPKARWARAFAHSFRLRRVPLVGRDRTYFLAMPRARRKAANGKANGAAGALLLLFGAFRQSIEVVWRARSLTTAGRFATLVQVSIEVTSCRCLHRGASRLLCTHALANAAQRLSSSDFPPLFWPPSGRHWRGIVVSD